MNDVKQDLDKELHSADLAELRKLKQELDDTRRVIEESSNKLYRDVSSVGSAPETPAIAPPPAVEAPAKPARPKQPRTKRAKRTVKSNGGRAQS
jgi:sec-independent protein translocase protein TatB